MRQTQLSELQLAIVRALWELGGGTISDLLAEVVRHGREHAPTTGATVLRRWENDRRVEHRGRGRQFVYHALSARGKGRNES